MVNKINHFIDVNINKILVIFLLLQPVIDLISGITSQVSFGVLSFGIAIRGIFLVFLFYYAWQKKMLTSDKAASISLVLIGMYIIVNSFLNLMDHGTSIMFLEIKDMVRYFYFPLLLILFNLLHKYKKLEIPSKVFTINIFIYTVVILLGFFTNTGIASYSELKFGTSGWFYSANEIGAIIGILFPIVFIYLIENFKRRYSVLILFLIVLASLLLGTKVPLFALIITFTCFFGFYSLKIMRHFTKKNIVSLIVPIIVTIIFFIFIIPNTPIGRNLGLNNDDEDIIHDTADVTSFIYNGRNIKMVAIDQAFVNSDLITKTFGMGHSKTSIEIDNNYKIVEMDMYDIVYDYGYIGIIVYFLFPIIIIFRIIKRLKSLRYLESEKINFAFAYSISVILGISIAHLTGHALSAPAVSIYVGYIITHLYNFLGAKGVDRK